MKILSVLALSLLFSLNSFCQSNAKESHVREFLEVTGSAKLGMQVMETMFTSYKEALPAVPAEFWDEVMKEIDPTQLIDLLVPIYMKHYSDEELVQLIAFYKSPVGKKVIEKLPLITQDSYKTGAEWGKKISEKVLNNLRQKGYAKES